MRITAIETLRVVLPIDNFGQRRETAPGGRPWDRMEALILRVETEDGRSGWGEAFGHTVNPGTEAVLQSVVGPWFLGKDAGAIDATMLAAQRAFHTFGRNGPVIYALSAFDIALWDLAAQRAGQPLFRLLGGSDPRLKLYASLMPFDGDAQAIARNCRKAHDAGFAFVKLHEKTIPAFMAAREAVDASVPIALDVNCPWTVDEAKEIARAIKGKGFAWLEEPVFPPEDFAGLAAVRREGVAIAGGENIGSLEEFRRAFQAGALDVAQPSVIKIGGISEMRRVAALAAEHGVRVAPHCFYWGPGYLAAAHFAASTAPQPLLETPFIGFERTPHKGIDTGKGELTLAETPGLGFAPDWGVLNRHMLGRHTRRA